MIEFLSDPFCYTCEYELQGLLLHGDKPVYCEKHQKEIDEFISSREYQELLEIFERSTYDQN